MTDSELKHVLANYLSSFVTESRSRLFHRVLAERTRYVKVLLEGVEDPVDVCAVLRSCECFGVQEVDLILEKSAFKLVQGAAVGAGKWLTIERHDRALAERTRACFAGLKARGYRIAAVTPRGAPIHSLPLDKPIVLCFGEQPHGLGEQVYEMADLEIGFPTFGFSRTFNLSICAVLCLSAVMNRLRSSQIPWRLGEDERLDLELEWLAKAPKRIKLIMARFLSEKRLSRQDLEKAGLSPHLLALLT